jgi:hypothetical protein
MVQTHITCIKIEDMKKNRPKTGEGFTIVYLLISHGNSWRQQWMHLRIAVPRYRNSEALHQIGVYKI